MSKSDIIKQFIKDEDHVTVTPKGEPILEQRKLPNRTILLDTEERPNIFAPTYDARKEFKPSELVNNISDDFWLPEDRVMDPPEDMLVKIKEESIDSISWKIPKDDKILYGITFFTEFKPASSLHEALAKALITYIPIHQAIANDNWITFILPEDKVRQLRLAVDFAGDKLTPGFPEGITQRNPTLDRK